MQRTKIFNSLILSAVLLAHVSASAEPPEATRQAIDETIRAFLVNLATDPQITADQWQGKQFHLQQSQWYELGLVVDTSSRPHLEVLAVTPGTIGAQAGIRSGDMIQSFNGNAIEAGEAGLRKLAELIALAEADTDFEFVLLRNGKVTNVNGKLIKLNLPPVTIQIGALSSPKAEPDGCGMVSFRQKPPHEFDLYPVNLVSVNGDQAGVRGQDMLYLTPGSYEIEVLDFIPPGKLRAHHKRFAKRREARSIWVQVEDLQVLHIGAKLLADRQDQTVDEPYWEPVVYKTEPDECKGRPVTR